MAFVTASPLARLATRHHGHHHLRHGTCNHGHDSFHGHVGHKVGSGSSGFVARIPHNRLHADVPSDVHSGGGFGSRVPTRTSRSLSSPRTTPTATMAEPASTPTRADEMVVLKPLPRVLVYDHCPFCIRVRYALGVKNIKHEVVWLMNDDVDTPTSLVGKKVVPIWQPKGAAGESVMESLDICKAVDGDTTYGPTGVFKPASDRSDISGWFSENANLIRRLTRPRNVRAQLPEFVFADARETFIRNHALPEPSDYDENFANTPALLAELQGKMQELDDMIFSPSYCTEGGLSFDDIDLFPRLRTLSIVRDLKVPKKTREYMEFHSELSETPLYDVFAM